MTSQILALIAACIGAFFMLVAAIGVLRMRDVYMRLHCTTKAATLGIVFLLAAAAIPSGDIGVWLRCAAASIFSIVTAPVVAHAVGAAAIRSGLQPIVHDSEKRHSRIETTVLPSARNTAQSGVFAARTAAHGETS
ncbi:MAG: monovalent cation/H(+) antiporter subunit G [Planctomycetota bacterium]|jgi:multicomponent Na+:H+ antiporter subunit G|nr:monovalent cation/H(+) antiporter subunit G [Planctomycetota bacterium]